MKADGNLGLGIVTFIIGLLWLLIHINIIPDWFPTWGSFLLILGLVLMWSGAKK